ncbi:hypothetical protein [Lactococcus lactis]|uniref:hypothetical protein n=1 Tax=Lactococcus lactis TaxID=1358 RepID=UPI003DAA4235
MNFKKEYLTDLEAAFYVSEFDYEVALPAIIVTDVKTSNGFNRCSFYDFPQNKLKTLALTGTKGKTTSAYFAKAILDKMNGAKLHFYLLPKQLWMEKIILNQN